MAWSLPIRALVVLAIAVCASALVAGCVDQSTAAVAADPPGGFALPPTTFVANIAPLIKRYGCFGCHMTDTYDGVESLPTAPEIVYFYESHHPEECKTLTYISPGAPDDSYLYQKVTGQGSCFTGDPMPDGSGPLPLSASAVVRDWILHGAVVE